MDPSLYKAAMEGNIDVLMQNQDQFDAQLTPTNNTVLHVTAQFRDNPEQVREILEVQPSLLCRVNSKGETALHIAARRGHSRTVQELIAGAKALTEDPESMVKITKEMLRMTNNEEKDTALHEAVRNNHLRVVELLVEEDPEFSYAANNSEETPLYLAAESGYEEIVDKILETCTSPAHSGPNGRSALHAAVFSRSLALVKQILDWKAILTKEADSYGWTPLHYAARFDLVECARLLLNADKSTAYLTAEKDENNTALHLAARYGNVETMNELLSYCPDCWEMMNDRGQNILHIAIETEKNKVIKFILNNSMVNNLLNQKDEDRNTPLHLLAASNCYIPDLIRHPVADKGAFNKKNLTPLDMATSTDRYRRNENHIIRVLKEVKAPRGWRNIVGEDKDKVTARKKALEEKKKRFKEPYKRSATFMLVATLIATVTFAAGFTVPGGYDGNVGPNQGIAVLVRKAAFKAFVISNTIAVVFSNSALFAFLYGSFYSVRQKVYNRNGIGFVLMLIAMAAMMIAFITGTYAVLATPSGIGLAIAVCVISCFSFCFCYFVFRRWCRDNRFVLFRRRFRDSR